jgi:hypothetical protein
VRAVRDAMASVFSTAVSAGAAGVVAMLEEQVAATPDREKWRPLREAIELLRTVLPGFEGRLRRHVTERFEAKLAPAGDEFSKTAMFSLALVAEDDMQEEIVIGNATRRLRDALAEELFHLTERLVEAIGQGPLPENRNPAFPRLFVRALLDALAAPGVSAQGRFMAFSAFSPALLAALRAAYQAANVLLVDRGVLPQLKRGYGAPQPVGSSRAANATGVPPALAEAPGASGASDASDASGSSALARARFRIAAIAARHGEARTELNEVVALLREEEMRLARSAAAS